MNVCDDKITKLKQRIKSELPVYSQEQINRSREVTLECALGLGSLAEGLQGVRSVFKSPPSDDVLRKVFKDQTERAILKSKQISNTRVASARVQMVHMGHKQSPDAPGGTLFGPDTGHSGDDAAHQCAKAKLREIKRLGKKNRLVKSETREKREKTRGAPGSEKKKAKVCPFGRNLHLKVY